MNKYLISEKKTILDALKQIDSISEMVTRTLFAVDEESRVLGAITDGDCRRGLIKGFQLSDPVSLIMKKEFSYFIKGKFDLNTIKRVKELGIKYVPELNDDGNLYSIKDFSNGKSYVPVDAVLMAGGKGERLRPLTLETPKPLLKVAGRAIIDYNVDNLLNNGIDHINVTVNYLKEQIEEHFFDPIRDVKVKTFREPKFLGTIGSIKYITEWHNDTVLLMNSDLFTNIDIERFYMKFKEHDADMSVAAVPYNVHIPYGIFSIKNEREITGIIEKPNYHYYANAGIYLIKRNLLDFIPSEEYFDATSFIDVLIRNNKKVIRFPITGYWFDIGKPEDYKNVQEFARNINKQ